MIDTTRNSPLPPASELLKAELYVLHVMSLQRLVQLVEVAEGQAVLREEGVC